MSAVDEKRFTALGREWIARFDFNAMCEIEENSGGRAFLEIVSPMLVKLDVADLADQAVQLKAVSAIRMGDIRLILHQSLQGAQPGTSAEQTGAIIGAIGFQAAMGVVAWAVVKAMGSAASDDSESGSDAAGGANPPRKPIRARKAG